MSSWPWLNDILNQLHQAGLYRRRRRLASAMGPRVRIGSREFINFASNDYLNLAADPRVIRAAIRALHHYGCGAGASPLIVGWSAPLRALERDLARWQGTESALVFSSGFAANLGVLTALVGPQDVVFSDELNHASLIDGCRLTKARIHIYRHADLDHLRSQLSQHTRSATCPECTGPVRGRFIVTDSVFSMDGDMAPLDELVELAERFQATLLVDEAHATGVLGPEGRGLVAQLARQPHTGLVKIGTLSKALGAQGGFVSGERVLIRYLVNRARSYIFSTALSIPAAAAARAALRIIRQEPQRRERLHHLARLLRQALRQRGLLPDSPRPSSGPPLDAASPIVPVILGEATRAVQVAHALQQRGFLVPAIRPPSVPPGSSRLRISLTAGHTEDDVRALADALAEVLRP
ncbi:MAG: 8-amino-7-oxononanoate synthase [Gemmatales bacterium]|nr:8-amino-7-oxononanoate synthase [Gemmatales bacterium]